MGSRRALITAAVTGQGIHPGRHERIVGIAVVQVSPRGAITGRWERLLSRSRSEWEQDAAEVSLVPHRAVTRTWRCSSRPIRTVSPVGR